MKISQYIKSSFILILAGGLLASCELDPAHKEFQNRDEIVYVGKPQELQSFAGYHRSKLSWNLGSDAKITKAKIFWNNPAIPEGDTPIPGQRTPGRDSLVLNIDRQTGIKAMDVVIDRLREGVYNFQVLAFDKDGNSSVKSETIGEVYGTTYFNSISNRPLDRAVYETGSKQTTLRWFGISQQAAVVDVEYTDVNDNPKTIHVTKVFPDPEKPGVFLERTTIPDYKVGTPIRFRTGFLPTEGAIDTFYTEYTTVNETFVNLAFKRPVFKSSDGSAGRAEEAVDGDVNTKWEPSSADRTDLNTWITVDLGSVMDFNEIQLYYESNNLLVPKYEILYSNTNTPESVWATAPKAYVKTSPPSKKDVARFPRVKARYVRLSQTLQATGSNVMLGEIEIWNKD